MCTASKPDIPPPPAPPAEPPRSIDPEVKEARRQEVDDARARAGRQTTIATGSLGLEDDANVAKRRSFGA